jgi:hypothetical protein
MTEPTKRDLENRIDDLENTPAVTDPAEAYSLLVALASGSATEGERERWQQVPAELRRRVAPPSDGRGT